MVGINARGVNVEVPLYVFIAIPYIQSYLNVQPDTNVVLDIDPTYLSIYIKILSMRLTPVYFFWANISKEMPGAILQTNPYRYNPHLSRRPESPSWTRLTSDVQGVFNVMMVADYLGDTEFVERFKYSADIALIDNELGDKIEQCIIILNDMNPSLIDKLFYPGTISYRKLKAILKDGTDSFLNNLISWSALGVVYFPDNSTVYQKISQNVYNNMNVDTYPSGAILAPLIESSGELYKAIMESNYPVSDRFIIGALTRGESLPYHRVER